jgi:hypothetical protein
LRRIERSGVALLHGVKLDFAGLEFKP